MDTDPPPLVTSETPALETPGVWPPPPVGAPPSPAPRPRTLTPYAWLDRLLGLVAGAGLAFALSRAVFLVQTVYENLPGPWEIPAIFGTIALLCAGPCLLVRRRFPILAALMGAGAAVLILIFGLIALAFRPW